MLGSNFQLFCELCWHFSTQGVAVLAIHVVTYSSQTAEFMVEQYADYLSLSAFTVLEHIKSHVESNYYELCMYM
jgi:hypothetical protein